MYEVVVVSGVDPAETVTVHVSAAAAGVTVDRAEAGTNPSVDEPILYAVKVMT